ncbi:hypothetical protein AAFF_G00149260 [Aldrovandia affinis]|uniref:Uncharacterized protein n=1 Tax=Aldrovandia affinis TaxID=143900 RepID=A0AAD7RRZ4_9TELE|nr:hypothetical protein AAFF_G00149260 [Aldrovandia affinis]
MLGRGTLPIQVQRMFSQIALVGVLCCLTLQTDLLEAASLMKIIKPEASAPAAISAMSIDPEEAHGFLSHPRPKRNLDPKWHRNTPDFQAYYKYYNSIGHIEGLYEIDRIRMLYQQMRHLEQVHGPNASLYQSTLGLPPAKFPAEAEEEDAAVEDPVPPVRMTAEPDPLAKNKKPPPFLYDYRRELFDPYLYTQPAPEPE